MKTFLKLALLLALTVYLIFAFVRLAGGGDDTKCKAVDITIVDSTHAGFITTAEVRRLLSKAGLAPVGKRMEDIDGKRIEQVLVKNAFVKHVTCYKTPGGRVKIHLSQRLPLLRVMADNGEDYYLDAEGNAMKPEGYHADLIVATGRISRDYARRKLACLARQFHSNPFAADLVVQVGVAPDSTVTLVPRVGCRLIRYGKLDSLNMDRKFSNLKAFYAKVLPEVGWNTYREISLEYADQIICKKK